MIRVATETDFPVVKELVQGLIRDSIYGKFFKGYELTPFMFNQYTLNPLEKLCLMIEDTKGFAMFDLVPWPYIDKEVKFARLSFIYIDPEYRGKGLMNDVLEAFEYWAKSVGAAYCAVGTKAPKRGYKKSETMYIKEIK